MKVQLLHIDDCPNSADAEARTRGALDALGLADVLVESVTIHSDAEAVVTRFGGSPTILVDGVDLFPTTPIGSLACRVYATANGYAGAPTQRQLEEALRGISR
ncbi:MAG: hypothetical protein ABF811_08580 [Pseudoclavibacter sp.]|jgi:hypothetical protein